MQHLDEGLLMALLDGELSGNEQRDVEAHLKSCAECSTRLQELRGFMSEADGLVNALVVPPAAVRVPPVVPVRRRIPGRTLAWAASIVAAIGLGMAARSLLTNQTSMDSGTVAISQDETASQATSASPPSVGDSGPVAEMGQMALRQRPPAAPAAQAGAGGAVSRSEVADLSDQRDPAEIARSDSLADSVRAEADIVRPGRADLARAETEAPVRPGIRTEGVLSGDTLAKLAAPGLASKSAENERIGEAESRALGYRYNEPAASGLAQARRPGEDASARTREEQRDGRFEPVEMEEAVRRLGGTIRLVDGLTPEELEVSAADSIPVVVRVTYRVGHGEVPLTLEQVRGEERRQVVPPAANPTSRRDNAVNRLEWNDLHGFILTLSGQFSPDSLLLFKARVK